MGVVLNAIPLAQGAGDVKAIRECIKVLGQGHALLVYPEGARTYDGKMHTFKTGVMLIIRKAKPTVVPVSIIGAYDIWPRTQKLPKLHGRLGAVFADPIPAEDLLKLGPDAALAHLKTVIADNRLKYRRQLGLTDLPEPVAEHPVEES
jgi:1-acyl-sn-glycerol-3-phosphate acyltransferase